MLFTIAHELTHFIRQNSPAKFDALADIVVNKSNLKGKISERIEQKLREAEDRGEPISRDTAYEEVIADSMETILTSGRVLEMMNEIQQQDKTLWEQIRDWFMDFINSIREAYSGVEADTVEGQAIAEMDDVLKELEQVFAEGLVDAGENFQTAGNTSEIGGVKYSYGASQEIIDAYVEAAYTKSNTIEYRKYADVSDRLLADVSKEIDLEGYAHALRDNDIRHINLSHGVGTSEKYPVTKDDIKIIPWIVENYDKVFVVKRADGRAGIVYVKAIDNGLTYYLEQATSVYGNERLLVNKQMIKTGIGDIPDLKGLRDAITKKQSETEFLNDLKKVPQVYVQDVRQPHSILSIRSNEGIVNPQSAEAPDISADAKTESVAPSVLKRERTWKESDYVQERDKKQLR